MNNLRPCLIDLYTGITNLVHHTFKKSLQSIAHVLCISFNQQRLLSLKAMKLLVSFAPDEDLIMELRTIVTILATVQAIENGSRDTQNEVGIITIQFQ